MDGRCYLLREFGTICYMPVWSKWKDLNTVPIIRAGDSHNAPFNPYTYVQIEVDGLYVSLNHPNVHGTCVAWGIKGGSLSPEVAVRLDFRPSKLAFWTFLLLDLLLPFLVFCICVSATPVATHHFLQLHCSSWSYFRPASSRQFFLYIGFFFFIVHLFAVGIVFGAYDFLGVKWTLQGPKCRALVLSLEKVVSRFFFCVFHFLIFLLVIPQMMHTSILFCNCCGGMGGGESLQYGTLLLLVWLVNAKKGADGVQYPRHALPSGPLLIRGKKKTSRLVEWVEKASFDRLNKLFMLSANEWNYQTLMTYQNMLAVV
ncbi:hypothetical protein AAG906_022786 [Vitis piasezkii]